MGITKVFVIVVTYNGKQWYDRCLGSLRQSEIPVQTVVIDNASNDGTVEYIRENYPEIHLIASNTNLGFGQGNNKGMRYALENDADYVFLLNQDAWIEPDTISKLLFVHKENPQYGILSPMHVNADKTSIEKGLINYVADLKITDPQWICDLYFGQSTQVSLAARWTMAELMQEWLVDLQLQSYIGFDAQQGRFIAEQRLMLGCCVLERKPLNTKLTETEQQQAWLDWLKQQGLQALPWTEQALQLRHRLQLMQRLMPEHQLAKVDDEALWADAEVWLAPALGRFTKLNDLNKLDLYTLLWQRLSYKEQQLLTSCMPDSWRSAVGSMIPVHYSDEGEAILSVRIQEMFGQLETPAVANGRLAMKIHLLSPARRPLQVTQDLASFWATSYAEVKKEMKGRYPKHYWPDNPAQAMPTNKTKKAMQK